MSTWSLDENKLKKYPHFDPLVSAKEAMAYVTDPKRIEVHKFYPLMLFMQRWSRFAKRGERGETKKRPIRYSARLDAYIYSYYRYVLSAYYEADLARRGLSESVIAYRRLQCKLTGEGMSNTHFASNAFEKIISMGGCCVIALDTSSFLILLIMNILKMCGQVNWPDKTAKRSFSNFQATDNLCLC